MEPAELIERLGPEYPIPRLKERLRCICGAKEADVKIAIRQVAFVLPK